MYPEIMNTLPKPTSTELQYLTDLRHDFHAHPEIGYAEHRTSERICEELTKAGVEFRNGLAGGTGVLAWIPGEDADRTIGLRADIDALPIEETSGVPWASSYPGRMHACGHDGHTTILLGTARALAEHSKTHPLPAPVVMLFQPAEEGGGGGLKMVQDGCLDGSIAPWKVSQMFGLHGWPDVREGMVGSRVGPLLAAADRFEITIEGKGAHAAQPFKSIDPITTAAAIVTALQTIVSRNVDPLEAAVVSVTTIHSGSAFNVIPTEAKITGTSRSLDQEVRTLLERRIGEVSQQIALAHGCTATIEYERGYPVTRNHPQAVNTFMDLARTELGDAAVYEVERPFMGAEDFSYYGEVVPACFFLLGLLPPDETSMPLLHASDFDFNDSALEIGVRMFSRLALNA